MIRLLHIIYFLTFFLILRFFSPEVMPEDLTEIHIKLQNHEFDKTKIHLEKDTQYILFIENLDASSEEFESLDLSIEKIIPANSSAYIITPKLSPGIYKFHGEFHSSTANGVFIVT